MHFLNYWQLLKQNTQLTPITIDGLDNDIEYDDTNFIDNIKQYILDLSEYDKPPDLTNLDIYKIFLRTIIPKIRILFSLVKKYIKGRLSLVDVVNYLEPFMIYPFDLTYTQYKEINSFIYEKIADYNKLYKEYSIAFSSLKYIKSKTTNPGKEAKSLYIYNNELFQLLETNNDVGLNIKILEYYGFETPGSMECSGSEFLKKITLADYGNLYNTAVSITNIKLMYPRGLSTVFSDDKAELKSIMEKDKSQDKCSTYIIAKKYYSMDALTEDNEKQIYFDKEFDTTNYDTDAPMIKRGLLTSNELKNNGSIVYGYTTSSDTNETFNFANYTVISPNQTFELSEASSKIRFGIFLTSVGTTPSMVYDFAVQLDIGDASIKFNPTP